MTQAEFDAVPFSEKFRIAMERHNKRPLADKLAVMVKAGLLTAEERQYAIDRETKAKARKAKKRKLG